MFFTLSKLFFIVVRPLNLLIGLLALGALLEATRFRRTGRVLLVGSIVALLVLGFSPLPTVVLSVLEDRFPRPEAVDPPPDGILVLGGSLDTGLGGMRPGLIGLNEAAERMTETAGLARRYPNAKVVFTGGSGDLFPGTVTEADAARILFADFGIAPERITIEDRSRNTWENAVFTREIVKPQAGQRWLLVTSAWHMPRAMGVFRQAGWPGLTAFPVDYRTLDGTRNWTPSPAATEGLFRAELAAKELFGLLAYRLTGRTGALLPGP